MFLSYEVIIYMLRVHNYVALASILILTS